MSISPQPTLGDERPLSSASFSSASPNVGVSRTTLAEDGADGVNDGSGGGGDGRGGVAGAVSRDTLQERAEQMLDRAKLVASCSIALLHAVVLVVLDAVMMRRRCSVLLGASFAVLAAALALFLASLPLALIRVRGRRALVCVCCLWCLVLCSDALWVGLVFSLLDPSCFGTAMIGAVAVGLVCCPASLVAFVILHGWLGANKRSTR